MLRARSRFAIVAAVLVAFIFGVFMGKYLFEPTEIIIPSDYPDTISLLTWKGWSGDLCFLLVPMTEHGRATHDFWSKWGGQCGISTLKEAVAAVPKDKHIRWHNWPSKFELPSEKFCDEMVDFAKGKGIDLELNPMLDAEMFSDWEPR